MSFAPPPPAAPAGRRPVWVCMVRERRVELGLSLRDLERAVGLGSSHLSQIEGGAELNLSNARRLAFFFQAAVEELWPELRGEAS